MSERALVTGGAGFIGAALVRALLARGTEVHAVVHPRTDPHRLVEVPAEPIVHRLDLLDHETLADVMRSAKPSVVFHTAASGGHPDTPAELMAAWRDTVLGTASLVESLAVTGVARLVHLGSSLEYRPSPQPLRESDPVGPVSARGAQKATAATVVTHRAAQLGVPVTKLRVFSVYGPGEPAGRLIPTLIERLHTGEPVQLTAGRHPRDFVYVDDVVEACLRTAACDAAAGATLNVGTGVETSAQEVARRVEVVTGRMLTLEEGAFPVRPSDIDHWCADMSLCEAVLGWRPAIDLDDGLRRMAEAYPWHRR